MKLNKTSSAFLIGLLLTSFVTINNCQAQIQKGLDIDGEAAEDYSGWTVSMPDVNTVAIGAPNNDANGSNAGHVRVFNWNGSAWAQKGVDIDGVATGDNCGTSISMPNANTIAIGAPLNDGSGADAGHVRIFSWNGTAWVQKGLDINGEAAGDQSGISVSMPDENTVAIGALFNDGSATNSGHVRIYNWNGTAWVQKGLDIDGEAANDQSGSSISMPDANTVAIGAIYNSGAGSGFGHTRIYSWNGTAWVQKGLDIDGEAANDRSGWSVSMGDVNTVAISARYNDGYGANSGHVRVYSWNGTTWLQKGIDINGEAAGDNSGWSVSMANANTLAISAIYNDGNGTDAGHTRIYSWNGTAWMQKGMDIDGETAGDMSGYGVSMGDANTVAIGARFNDGSATNAGHVRVFSMCTATTGTDIQTACGSFTWIDGNTYTTSNNTATHTIVGGAANGCDSIVTLNLTINNPTTGTDIQTACGSFTWIDGNTYTASNNTATHTIVGGAANGCDSIVTLNLTINNSTTGTDIQTACGSFTWIDGNTYTTSNNTATYTLTNAAGCDSVVTLNLTINNSTTGTDTQTACGSFTWIDGNTYTASNNTATHTIVGGAANGCDSIVTLNLTIQNVDVNVNVNGITLTANASVLVYQWIDCSNNTAIPGATNQSFTATANGNYAVVVTDGACSDTSACFAITTVSLHEQAALKAIQVYPNPASSSISIASEQTEIFALMLLDNAGRIVYQAAPTNKNYQIPVAQLTNGLYVLHLETKQGTTIRLVEVQH